MSKKSELAEFQEALAEVFASGLPHAQILERLKTDARFDKYRSYVEQFDPDMVAVACELMGKWAKRSDNSEGHL
ncbi:MAG TPA: hypothetical protein V6C81_13625 [Planktothrix sp.]|jgi:hypothetical protein